ncbi:MAG: cytidylate kinase-like family protein [Oscillospiraceae bacterium]|nr:cytidylate kinase-like family protein [Oscillospiraceae bacterium]
MKIITISREFGSGGRELGKRISDVLGCDYYDSEIIAAVAKQSGLDAAYVATALGEHGWKQYPITFRNTLGSASYLQSSKVNLLLQQRRVLEEIAKLGKDCVIVGRNADTILREYEPFRVFVCADMETKLRRCRERAPEGENLTDKELMRQIKHIDKLRAQTREILSGEEWGQRDAYHLTVNTTDWEMKELAAAVAGFAEHWFGRKK